MKTLLERWRQVDRKYAALSRRERLLVGLAALALAAYLGNVVWVAPAFSRAANVARLAAQQEKELAALQAQLDQLQVQMARDPNAPLRQSLADLGRRSAEVDARLKEFESTLIPPRQMGAALGQLLRQVRGVRLLSLRTLPAESLLPPAPAGQQEGGGPAAGMFRHGYELSIEGNYLDLTAYLAELERQPQRLLWQHASLSVEEYPTAVLTLRFHSLSLEKDWLAL